MQGSFLWVWLLGVPLVLAVFDLLRSRSSHSSSTTYDSTQTSAAPIASRTQAYSPR